MPNAMRPASEIHQRRGPRRSGPPRASVSQNHQSPDRFTTEYKCYAPGLGMVSDGTMKLVKVVKGRP